MLLFVVDENGCDYDAKWRREGRTILNHFKCTEIKKPNLIKC